MREGRQRQQVYPSISVETSTFAKGHRKSVTSASLSFDESTAATSSKDGSILLCTQAFYPSQ